ncbi:MAG: SCP2 sterol-binding domain-containing protein [Deltaproteobacteria bacterium]|nr:SCP2 sterol-binding domain-containing protein [Deltaproteobacteria bacterium]
MHPKLQAATRAPAPMTARRFFGEICPVVFEARRPALMALGGRFAFVVRGEGAWLLDFPQGAVRQLEKGSEVEADLAIEIEADAFARLMKGNLDVRHAVDAGQMAVVGNTTLFPNLSAALRPST